MKDDQLVVAGDSNVDFDPVDLCVDRGLDCASGVANEKGGLRGRESRPAVAYDERAFIRESGAGVVIPLQSGQDGATLQIGKVLAGIVSGQLFDPAEVGVGAALAKSFELDKAGEFLIPLLGSDDVLWPIYFFSSDWEA